ncbi:outer membrane-specific lipoprotein transporter subunit LolE [Planctomycetes bacterium Pan216]|uniref:Outer membrane-specific lipoprotein transporter subunit LolE n=1 Tax=Kolteria novifilia TaxID=2527975 RepID=A0A518BCE2_9BACT|nr:outer membrane-specific lipoprotein transporter subunit LolE [Planctomycetes bacterium Pan216]
MTALDRKLLRDLRSSRGLIATIVAISALGTACFVCLLSAYNNLELARGSYYVACRMADFSIELKKAPLAALEPVAGVETFRPRIRFAVTIDLEDEPRPLSGQVISLPEKNSSIINGVQLRRGSYFSGERANEVIVNDAFARARRLRPGDKIHVLLNNRRQELVMVGTAISSEFVYLIAPGSLTPDPANHGILYVPANFAEEVFDFEGAANQVLATLSPRHKDRPDEVIRRWEERLKPYGIFSTTKLADQPSHKFLTSELQGLQTSATFLPTVFLTVAALVLNVLMTRIAQQQRVVVGTLKALGYTNGQVYRHFLKFGMLVGLAGGVLGVVIGFALAGALNEVYRHYFEFPSLVNRPYPAVVLGGIAISLVFSAIGTLRGAWTVLRQSPAEAMRPAPMKPGGATLLERIPLLWGSLGSGWRMVLRGMLRARMRTFAGLAAAAAGAAILFVSFFMMDAIRVMLDFQFEKVLLSDIDVSFKDERDEGAIDEIRRLPGVDRAEPLLMVPCTLRHGSRHRRVSVTGVSRGARLTVPHDRDGNAVAIPSSGLLLSRPLAEILDARRGDRIILEPVKGIREPIEVPVARIVDNYMGLSVYADMDYLNELIGEERAISVAQLKVVPGLMSLLSLYRELKRLPGVEAVTLVRANKEGLERTVLTNSRVMTTVILIFAGVIFFGSILNASLISLAERQREIATFRVLGYGPYEIGGLFLKETLLVNTTGAILGLPLGYWLCVEMAHQQATELFRIPIVVEPSSWFITVLIAIGFSLLAHTVVQSAVNRMAWLEALNVRE